MRVCTTVAIAIVAETCSPFTVLPALMNEYRVPELNVQNGVLKSLSFLFEYIGEMGKDYIYAVTPLLEDALMDRWVVCVSVSVVCALHLCVSHMRFSYFVDFSHAFVWFPHFVHFCCVHARLCMPCVCVWCVGGAKLMPFSMTSVLEIIAPV